MSSFSPSVASDSRLPAGTAASFSGGLVRKVNLGGEGEGGALQLAGDGAGSRHAQLCPPCVHA